MATGHVEAAGRGRWKLVLDLGIDPVTGKRERKSKRVRGTKMRAREELARWVADVGRGNLVEPSRELFGAYLKRWLEQMRPRLAPSTHHSYRRIVEGHVVPAIGRIPLAKISAAHLQSYYADRLAHGRKMRNDDGVKGSAKTERGLSPRYVQYHHAVIREALSHAVRMGLVMRNVADLTDPPRPRRPEFNALDPEAVATLLSVAAGARDYALIYAAIFTGLRMGELCGLHWADVDLQKAALRVRTVLKWLPGQGHFFGPPKTRSGARSVPLPASLVAVLRAHRKDQASRRLQMGVHWNDNDLVFCERNGNPMQMGNLERRFRALRKTAGMPTLRFHDLRHTHASLLLAQGIHPKVVQERLGHASIQLTMDTYSHVLPRLHDEAAAALDDILAGTQAARPGTNSAPNMT